MIRRAGFKGAVVLLESGRAALDCLAIANDVSTIIFLDINMPEMDDFVFARQAESALGRRFAHTVIVMLTSSSAHSDPEQARSIAIIDGFVVKPSMVDTARKLLDGEIDPILS